MKRTLLLLSILGVVLVFTSCTKPPVGKWNVDKYEMTSPGQQGITMTNIGTMTFNKDGSGTKNISYTALGVQVLDESPFKWLQGEGSITIEGEGSDFAKTWILLENSSKVQKWKSTDGVNQVQVLEMSKVK